MTPEGLTRDFGPKITRWEYARIVEADHGGNKTVSFEAVDGGKRLSTDVVINALTAAGHEGWELVAVDTQQTDEWTNTFYVLKREASGEPTKPEFFT